MLSRRSLLKIVGGLGVGAVFPRIGEALQPATTAWLPKRRSSTAQAPRLGTSSELERARSIAVTEEWEDLLDDLPWEHRVFTDVPQPGPAGIGPASFCPRCGDGTFCKAPCGFTCYAQDYGLSWAGTRVALRAEIDRGALRQARHRLFLELWEVVAEASRYFEHVLWDTPEGQPGRDFLDAQGIDRHTARRFALGYCAVGSSKPALLRHLTARGLAKDGDCPVMEDVPEHAVLMPLRDARERGWGWVCQGCGGSGAEAGWTTYACDRLNAWSLHRHRRLVYPLPSWPDDLLRHEAVLCVDRPWEVVLLAQAGIQQVVHPYTKAFHVGPPRGTAAAYRTALALAARVILPVEAAALTPGKLLRLADHSTLSPDRLAILALPAGQAVRDLLRTEGPAAVRERMETAPTLTELLGL